MFRHIYVFRHGHCDSIGNRGWTCWSPDRVLSDKGKEQMAWAAQKWGAILGCSFFAASPLPRAVQSLCIMMLGLGRLARELDNICFERGLWTLKPEVWYADEPQPVVEVWQEREKEVEREGQSFFLTVSSILSLTASQNILCVSHGGLIEAGVAWGRRKFLGDQLAFPNMQDLDYGEGFWLNFDDNSKLVETTELRFHKKKRHFVAC